MKIKSFFLILLFISFLPIYGRLGETREEVIQRKGRANFNHEYEIDGIPHLILRWEMPYRKTMRFQKYKGVFQCVWLKVEDITSLHEIEKVIEQNNTNRYGLTRSDIRRNTYLKQVKNHLKGRYFSISSETMSGEDIINSFSDEFLIRLGFTLGVLSNERKWMHIDIYSKELRAKARSITVRIQASLVHCLLFLDILYIFGQFLHLPPL